MNGFRSWYAQCRQEGTADIRFFILWFMVAIYPLLVIPHLFYITFPLGQVQPGFFYAPRYVVLAFMSLVAIIVLLKDKTPVNHPAYLPLTLFIIFSMISSFLAPVPMTAWIGSPYRFTGASTYYFCIVLFILAHNTVKIQETVNCMVITSSIVSLLAILQYFNINLVPHEPGRDGLLSYGTLAHPNFLGTYTAFTLPAAVLLFIKSKEKVWLLCAALIYTGLVVSLCRGTWLSFAIGFLIIALHFRAKADQRKNLLILAIIFLAITVALLPARDGFLIKRLLSVPGELGSAVMLEKEAGTYRMFIWHNSIKLLRDFWAFGIGPDHLIYAKLITPASEWADKVHNIYLEIGVTMGVFALASYLAFLSFILRRWKSEQGFLLFTMIVVYLIQGFFNIDVVMNMPVFWIVLGLSLAESKKYAQPQL